MFHEIEINIKSINQIRSEEECISDEPVRFPEEDISRMIHYMSNDNSGNYDVPDWIRHSHGLPPTPPKQPRLTRKVLRECEDGVNGQYCSVCGSSLRKKWFLFYTDCCINKDCERSISSDG